MGYNEDEETFEATARFRATGSSFVEEVAYDRDENELLVYLDSGRGYLYDNVPVSVFEKFNAAHSRGQFYNNHVKRGSFAPGTEVAWDTEVVDKPVVAPDMGAVTRSVPAAGTITLTANAARAGGGYSSYSMPSAVFDLAPPVEEFTYSHTVDYTVDGGNKVYSATVEAGKGVFDGIDKVVASLETLNLDYEIKGVYVKVNG